MIAAAATAFITYAGLWPVIVDNASAAFGVGILSIFVVTFVAVLVFDWIPRSWRLFALWFDWIWRHPMDNSTGPLLEPEQSRTYTDDELGRAMDATIEAHRAKQRK